MRISIASRLIVLSAAMLVAGSTVLSAQTFGTSSQELIIPAQNWTPAGGGYQFNGNGSITPTVDGAQTWITSLGVPAGAQIASIDFLITDNDASMDISMTLSVSTFPLGLTGSCGGNFASTTSVGVSGLGIVTMAAPLGASPVTYHSSCNSLETLNNIYLSVTLQTTQHTLWGARVTWNRSVSPAPELGSFGDVPSSDFGFQYIEALNASGITGGCGSGNYCPDSPVTRRQMAIFIAKSLGLYFPK